MIRRIPALFAFLASAIAFLSCMGGGNSGSETTNGLTGVIRDVEGRPVAGARVLLLSEEFDPAGDDSGGAPMETRTDGKGAYRFEDVPPALYHLQISDSVRGALALIQDVAVTASDGMSVLDGALGMPGSLKARIADFVGSGEKGYAYIPGTTALARVDSATRASGTVEFAKVPVGHHRRLLLVIEAANDKKIITLARDFEVMAESTLAPAPFQTWAASRKIPINTKAMGVTAPVTDFPLLVRLNASNFDFTQAQANGQDIRFSKADGTPAPFQIERWSREAGRAEIWVRIDSVAGSDAEQYINMHWGRGLTMANVPNAGVFDASAGFSTVYHLDEAANEDVGGYRDASANGNHATAASINPDAQVPGIIGSAKSFKGGPLSTQGTLAASTPKGFAGNSSFTVSFWMRFNTTATRQTILDFGAYGNLKDVHFLIRPDSLAQFGAYDGGSSGFDPATWQNVFKLSGYPGRWFHVATIYDAQQAKLTTYINGALVDAESTPPLLIDASGGLRIGMALATHPKDSPFNGALDEIRFCDRSLSAYRIRLDYETQKP